MKELFFDFLRKNNAYYRWMEKYDPTYSGCSMNEFLDYDPAEWVSDAFRWGDEFEFWIEISNSWYNTVESTKVFTITEDQLRQLCKESCGLHRPTQHDELIATSDRIFGAWFEKKLKELK